MSETLPGILAGLLFAGILQGCPIALADQQAIRQAWEARETPNGRVSEQLKRGLVAPEG